MDYIAVLYSVLQLLGNIDPATERIHLPLLPITGHRSLKSPPPSSKITRLCEKLKSLVENIVAPRWLPDAGSWSRRNESLRGSLKGFINPVYFGRVHGTS